MTKAPSDFYGFHKFSMSV